MTFQKSFFGKNRKFIFLFICILLTNQAKYVFASDVVLIPPFENLSRYKAITSYKTNTGIFTDTSRNFTIDRYSEITRNKTEDILINNEISVVERQRIDAIVLEGDFVTMSGLVESSKSIELGNMLGATKIIQGTIIDIKENLQSFSGYGIRRTTNKISATLRIRIIDINKGKVVFSKIFKGEVVSAESNFSHTEYNDKISEVLDSSFDSLLKDDDFQNFIKLLKGEKYE